MKSKHASTARLGFQFRYVALALGLFSLFSEVYSQDIPEAAVFIVFEANGNVAPAYRDAFKHLEDRAEAEGHIPTWIRLQFNYNPDLEPETEEYRQQEDAIDAVKVAVMDELNLDDDNYLGSTVGAPYFSALLTAAARSRTDTPCVVALRSTTG